METIQIIIISSNRAKEVNPLGEKPELRLYPHYFPAEAAWEYDLNKWVSAESKLREFEIAEVDQCHCDWTTEQPKSCKVICTDKVYVTGSVYTAEVLSEKEVRIIK